MIAEIRLRNFKCFDELDLRVAPLTILSGSNGAGKSTVLQALLLLRQSAIHGELQNGRVVFNGDLVQLGSAGATMRDDAPLGSALELAIEWDDGAEAGWRLALASGELRQEVGPDDACWSDRPPVARCRYVSADRIGPRPAFSTSDVLVKTVGDAGARGEFTAHYLAVHGNKPIPVPDLHFQGEQFGLSSSDDAASQKLRHEVEAWLGLLVRGVRIDAELHESMDVVRLGFRFPGPLGLSDPRRPTHVGFGLTYVLPILVALLAAEPGSLVIIENPEAHLHPRAQRQIVELFARAARAGVQVLVETHSDHVLNGVRLAVRKGTLKPEMACIHFFTDDPKARLLSPRIHESGALSEWPPGFFDEWDRALDELLA